MAKENALKEFINHVGNNINNVKCATIMRTNCWTHECTHIVNLFENHNTEQFDSFLKKLDFEYDAGYGGQELFGIIWFKDGTWSTRGEYDGSEWWEYHKCPSIEYHGILTPEPESDEFTYWDGDITDPTYGT
jgi:hypothetical protein